MSEQHNPFVYVSTKNPTRCLC